MPLLRSLLGGSGISRFSARSKSAAASRSSGHVAGAVLYDRPGLNDGFGAAATHTKSHSRNYFPFLFNRGLLFFFKVALNFVKFPFNLHRNGPIVFFS